MHTATDRAARTRFGGRHPRSVIVIRVLVTAWLLALTGVLLAYGYWGWALLTIAGAVGVSQIHGMGVFAREDVKKGALVWVSHKDFDHSYTAEQIARLPEPTRLRILSHCYLSPRTGKYFLCGDEARFMNHSDSYNLVSRYFHSEEEARTAFGIGDEVDWIEGVNVAGRDISAGEELTCDYKEFDLDFQNKLE